MATNRRRLKILHLDPEREWGGGETQVKGLLQYLSSRKHQNHLLCHPEGALFHVAREIGIRVLPFRLSNDFDIRPVFSIKGLIRREGYGIVHFHTKRAHAMSLFLGRVEPWVRYLVTRRMDYPVKKGWYTHSLYNKRVDGVVAISDKIAALLVQAGVDKEKIRIIHSGIDPIQSPKDRATDRSSGIPIIGTVASLEERKGHRYLLEAARLLKNQGHRLSYQLAGVGTQRRVLEQSVLRLGLEDEVVFSGFVSEIPSFLSRIDIFVLPSLYEGLGVAVIEAMAAGKPVVASRVGGLPELIEDCVTGFLVPPGDPSALAQAISRMLSSEGFVEGMGAKGKERVQKRFTMERMAKQNEDFYYDLVDGRQR